MSENETEQARKPDGKLLRTGLIGSFIAAICCFTPILVIAFVGAGLGVLVGGLDYFLFPMLFGSLGLVAQALYLNFGQPGPSPKWIIIALILAFSALLFLLQFRLAVTVSIVAALLVAAYWLYLRSRFKQARAG